MSIAVAKRLDRAVCNALNMARVGFMRLPSLHLARPVAERPADPLTIRSRR
jgi:hypothetical protein